MSEKPNILLIVTDQQRADCLGAAGHPCLLTPQMDELALQGVRFTSAYTTCPACQPTRRNLLGGKHPARNGAVTNTGEDWNRHDTVGQILRDSGYHTGLIGHMARPDRKRFGFEEMITGGDYVTECLGEKALDSGMGFGSGAGPNDYTVRPWHMDESLHKTNWMTSQALRFLRRKDPARPWFLTVSYLSPHPPLFPPDFYFQRYLRSDIPQPAIGDWAQKPDFPFGLAPVDSPRVELKGQMLREYRAAYYASINHIDDQIRRILTDSNVRSTNTIVVFVSDHGDMLGDHYMTRKTMPHQASANVPFIIKPNKDLEDASRGVVCDIPVCHEDIMPTLLDIAGADCPEDLDGKSLVPILTGKKADNWRDSLHIEYGEGGTDPFHAMTDGREKYIWFSKTGHEQYFKLDEDPNELCNLIGDSKHSKRIDYWRNKLIETISWRGEGFVKDGKLVAGCPHPGRTAQYNSTII